MPLYNSGAGMDMSMGGSYDQVQRPQARSSRLFGSPAVSGATPVAQCALPNNGSGVPVSLEDQKRMNLAKGFIPRYICGQAL